MRPKQVRRELSSRARKLAKGAHLHALDRRRCDRPHRLPSFAAIAGVTGVLAAGLIRDDLRARLALARVGEQPPSSTPSSLPVRTKSTTPAGGGLRHFRSAMGERQSTSSGAFAVTESDCKHARCCLRINAVANDRRFVALEAGGSAGGAWLHGEPTGLISSRRHIEPCMRFSRTRLTDVLHRRHSVGPA